MTPFFVIAAPSCRPHSRGGVKEVAPLVITGVMILGFKFAYQFGIRLMAGPACV